MTPLETQEQLEDDSYVTKKNKRKQLARRYRSNIFAVNKDPKIMKGVP